MKPRRDRLRLPPIRDETESNIGTPEQYKDQAEEQEIGDLSDIELSDADRMMDKVYGDHVPQIPGTHLRGAVHCLPNRRFVTFAGGEEGKRREEATHLAHGCLAAGQIIHARSNY
jgi:hypothetical protein